MSVIQQRIGLLSMWLEFYRQLTNKTTASHIKTNQDPPSGDAGSDLVGRLNFYITLRPPPKDADIPVIIHANKVTMATRLEHPSYADTPASAIPNSLSRALSERHGTDMLFDRVGHKLVQSTLDHLRTSIRYAKTGDTESSRLHAIIMNSALKEAANHVSEKEYQELVQRIDNELSELN